MEHTKYTEQAFCQSCGMPMNAPGAAYGNEANGSPSADYCSYCYQHGAFTGEMTMAQMIDFCVSPMVENNPDLTEAAAREMMQQFFPTLKRWRKS